MTLGQRIAQKRKELGLSQEGLGDQLGVSRQAIYKWESDASLPEIDKLITLGKIFSVPVGWLLGVEENAPVTVDPDREKLAEEVLSRYQAAQPEPRKSVWDKWSVRILFALCGIMLALLVGVNTRVKDMEQDYRHLTSVVNTIDDSVNSKINSVTSRLESALEEHASLIVEWSAELASTDLAANTATFQLRVVPKVYTEGMTALFAARSGQGTVEVPAQLGPGSAFTGQVTCPLSDDISLSVVFLTGDQQQPQPLRDFQQLYTDSFPALRISTQYNTTPASLKDHLWSAKDFRVTLWTDSGEDPNEFPNLQVGLFRDTELVQLLEPDVYYDSVYGINPNPPAQTPCWSNPRPVTLESGIYTAAVLYTDEYGRQYVYYDWIFEYDRSVTPPINNSGIDAQRLPSSHDPADWAF